MATFGGWRYTCDREATIAAYAQVALGGSGVCTCDGCRNYVLARKDLFPTDFLKLLGDLGIDSLKEAEAFHTARSTPGFHHYGGWFHFVGTLESAGDFPVVDFGDGFSAWMSADPAPRLSSLIDLPVVQLGFQSSAVPWLLDEAEPI